LNAQAGPYVTGVGEIAQGNLEAIGGFLDAGFGKARGLKELTRNGSAAGGVQGGRRFGLVGCPGGIRIEIGSGPDFDFHFMKGAFGFDDAVPAEG